MTKVVGVYMITNTVNGKRYVGSSCDVKHRLTNHLGGTGSLTIARAVKKYGSDAFVTEVLEECGRHELPVREEFWLETLNPEYNFVRETSSAGRVFSEETKARMSVAAKGRPCPMAGKKHTPESRAKMSAAASGRRLSDATKAKLSVAGKGRRLSDAHRAAISRALTGTARLPHTEHARRLISEASKRHWGNPEYRRRCSVGRRKAK